MTIVYNIKAELASRSIADECFFSRSAPTLSHESIASGGEESESGERLEEIGLLLLFRMNKFNRRRNAPIVDRYEQHFSPVRLTCSNGRISPRLWRGRTV